MFQSAPEFITPGNTGRCPTSGTPGGFQSAPAFITPGNGGPVAVTVQTIGFNPPRRSSPRGTAHACSLITFCRFQSAPAFIAPGNAAGTDHPIER